MKKLFFTFCVVFISSVLCVSAQEKDLTLMSYNIHIGVGMDKKKDLSRIARVINHVSPDVVGLQEVDSMNTRTMEHQAKELAMMTNMYEVYAPAISMKGNGKYGIALLSKEKPLGFKRIGLPGSEELRVAVLVEFEDYIFVNTHLSLTEKDRVTSAEIILNEVRKYSDKPVFLSGDLNAEPNSEAISEFKKGFTILSNSPVPTFPSTGANVCIDYIMAYNNNVNMVKNFSYVYDEPLASDHLPIVVGVRIEK